MFNLNNENDYHFQLLLKKIVLIGKPFGNPTARLKNNKKKKVVYKNMIKENKTEFPYHYTKSEHIIKLDIFTLVVSKFYVFLLFFEKNTININVSIVISFYCFYVFSTSFKYSQ